MNEIDQMRVFPLTFDLSPCSALVGDKTDISRPKDKGVTVELWGTGEPYREFLHVDDLADACVFLVERYDYQDIGEIVNIGVGKDQKIRELAERVRSVIGYDGAIEYDDSKPDGTPRKLLDVTRLRSLGWSLKISIEEGIKNTYTWYCDSSLILQRQIIKNPTPALTLPLKGRGFYGVFSLSWKVFQSLPFQGGGQEGDGVYMSL